jgi:hypothetical protein
VSDLWGAVLDHQGPALETDQESAGVWSVGGDVVIMDKSSSLCVRNRCCRPLGRHHEESWPAALMRRRVSVGLDDQPGAAVLLDVVAEDLILAFVCVEVQRVSGVGDLCSAVLPSGRAHEV